MWTLRPDQHLTLQVQFKPSNTQKHSENNKRGSVVSSSAVDSEHVGDVKLLLVSESDPVLWSSPV